MTITKESPTTTGNATLDETLGSGLPSNIFYDEDDAEVSDETVYAGMARRGESPDFIKVPAMKAAYIKFLKTFKKS